MTTRARATTLTLILTGGLLLTGGAANAQEADAQTCGTFHLICVDEAAEVNVGPLLEFQF